MTDRVISRCGSCNLSDADPKLHYGMFTWHHDCVPLQIKAEILGSVHPRHTEKLRQIFIATETGIKGDDLLSHIENLHKEG